MFSVPLLTPPPQWLLLLTSQPFELYLSYLGQRIYWSGKMYWMTFWWPWPKVMAVTLINKKLLVCRIKWEPLNQSLQNLVAISHWSYHLIRFWKNSVGNSYLPNFPWKFRMCFFSRSNTLLDMSQEWLVRLMWNEKEVHQLDTGWTMWPWPSTSPMTLTFDFSRSNFKIAVSQELLSDWCETKRKQVN